MSLEIDLGDIHHFTAEFSDFCVAQPLNSAPPFGRSHSDSGRAWLVATTARGDGGWEWIIGKHISMVSGNRGTPKSSIWTGYSIINHPFWGTPIIRDLEYVIIIKCTHDICSKMDAASSIMIKLSWIPFGGSTLGSSCWWKIVPLQHKDMATRNCHRQL